MSNIVVPEAGSWSEAETERNVEILKSMGLEEDIKRVQSIRRKGTSDPGIHLAGLRDLQDTESSKKGD